MAAGLILIGIGLGGINGMTVEALNAAKSADLRRYEAYTALWKESDIVELESEIGKITKIMRPEIEDPKELFTLAAEKEVALLIVGDPLQATTHVDLQLRAVEAGISCKTVHGISITSVVTGAIGLSNYRFGRQTTLTYPYQGWVATSPLEVIAFNRIQGLHTLVLLDLDPTGEGSGKQNPMQPKDAANVIRQISAKLNGELSEMPQNSSIEQLKFESCKKIVQSIDNLPIILCSDMGTDAQRIQFLSVSTLATALEGRLHCLVVPAEMGEVESLALKRWSKQ
jgi:diphthine synthase